LLIEGNWLGSRGCECFGSNNETPFEEELRLLKTIGWSAKAVVVCRDEDGKCWVPMRSKLNAISSKA
jgi:hypothetical protein